MGFQALDQDAGVYNVQTFGAKGDGVADDTAAIQAAINAASLAGGIVFLGPGTFKISATLTITSSGVSLVGAGTGVPATPPGWPTWKPATQLSWAGNITDSMIHAISVQGCRIETLGLNGNNACARGIWLTGWVGGVLRSVSTNQFGYITGQQGCALYVEPGAGSGDVSAFNVYESLWLEAAQPIYLTGVHTLTGDDATVSNWSNIFCFYGQGTNNGVTFDVADAHHFNYLYVFFNNLVGGTGYDIYFGPYARGNVITYYAGGNGVYAANPAFADWNNLIWPAGPQPPGGNGITRQSAAVNLYYLQLGDSSGSRSIQLPHISGRDQVLRENSGIIGEPFPRSAGATVQTLTGGTIYLVAIGLMAGDIVTNVLVDVATAGVGTSLSKVGIYNKTGALQGKSADQGAVWNTAGAYAVPLTSPYTVLTTDIYYLAVIANAATTVPSLWRGTNDARAGFLFSGFLYPPFATATATGQTDLISSVTLSLANAYAIWQGWS